LEKTQKEKRMNIDLNEYRAKRSVLLDGWSKRFDEMEKQLHSSPTVYRSSIQSLRNAEDSKKMELKVSNII
jgi:hypothetical protein